MSEMFRQMSRGEKNRTKRVALRRLRALHYPEYIEIRRVNDTRAAPWNFTAKQLTQQALYILRNRYRREWEGLRIIALK